MTATMPDTTIARKRTSQPRTIASRIGRPSSNACRTRGTSRPIACRDNTAPLDDCWQRDDFGWFQLQKQELPQVGTAWVHVV